MSHLLKIANSTISLPLDVITRWDSIVPMVKRYMEVKQFIKQALEKFGEGEKFCVQYDGALQQLLETLEPLTEAVLELSKENSNLVIAEFAIRCISDKLTKSTSSLSKKVLAAVIERYNERRNKHLISLMLVLEAGKYPSDSTHFEYSTNHEVNKTAADLVSRLFQDELTATQAVEENLENTDDMRSGIGSYYKTFKTATVSSLEKDFSLLALTGIRSARLENLHQALLSLKPTSTVCEQSFSTASSFKTKNRNRMSPSKLAILIWLKNYFCT